MTTKEFENYEPKGQLIGFPKEIIARMLECQEEQGNKKDIEVFEKQRTVRWSHKGFDWDGTKEGWYFWGDVINNKNFNHFFEKYPKKDNQDNPQEFRVGDKVIYYIANKIGIVEEVKKHKFDNDINIVVNFGNNDICEYKVNSDTIRPFLLHYRDDYDYDVIDFNNLPKRQEANRWRAKEGETYYSFSSKFEVKDFCEDGGDFDNKAYKTGNYFQTKEEAQEVADKLNKYFRELINPTK